MKMNEKMKEVQRKYREELKKQELEDDKNYIKETIIVVTIIVLFIVYCLFFILYSSLTPCKVFNKKIPFSHFDTYRFFSQ
ncbi:hypothetical protein DFO78_10826 [Bacillus subtilis]|nr:hypothetical protein DFO78_10826 [Bacillus subtilis]